MMIPISVSITTITIGQLMQLRWPHNFSHGNDFRQKSSTCATRAHLVSTRPLLDVVDAGIHASSPFSESQKKKIFRRGKGKTYQKTFLKFCHNSPEIRKKSQVDK